MNDDRRLIEAYLPIGPISVAVVVHRMPCALCLLAFLSCGFNQTFKQYFGTNPVETTQRLAKERKITIRPVRGGVMLYRPEEAPGQTDSKRVLETILGGDEEPEKGSELRAR